VAICNNLLSVTSKRKLFFSNIALKKLGSHSVYLFSFCNTSINYLALTSMIPFLLDSNLFLFVFLTVFLAVTFADMKRIFFLIVPLYAALYYLL